MARTQTALAALKRPRLLISAARFGVAQYDREAVLREIFGAAIPAPGEACLSRLLEHEAEIEASRKNALGNYAIADHVDALVAIMAESRLLSAAEPAVAHGPAAECEVIPLRRRAEDQLNASRISDLRRAT